MSEVNDPAAVGAPPVREPAVNTDLVGSVTKIDRSIKLRRDNDVPLVNWWLYFLLLSWITFGTYAFVVLFKRVARVDRFSERKRAYYDGVLEWTERQAAQRNQEALVHDDLTDLHSEVARAYQTDLRPLRPGLSVLLTIVTLGIYSLYVLYRLNRYWWDAQTLEQDFDDRLSQTWMKLGLARYPMTFEVDPGKRRSYPLYLLLSIVTFGIWGCVWDYKIHTDPDNIFGEFHGIEDTVLQIVRAH